MIQDDYFQRAVSFRAGETELLNLLIHQERERRNIDWLYQEHRRTTFETVYLHARPVFLNAVEREIELDARWPTLHAPSGNWQRASVGSIR